MHPRGVIRRDVRAALAALARFSGARLISSWTQNVTLTPGDAPVYGVSTPREVSQPASASDVERQTDVVVHLARVGGDEIEDDLDDDSIAIEAAVLPVLAASGLATHQLAAIDIELSGEGAQPLGKLTLTFRAGRFTRAGQDS